MYYFSIVGHSYASSDAQVVQLAIIHRQAKAIDIPPAAIRYVGTANLQSSLYWNECWQIRNIIGKNISYFIDQSSIDCTIFYLTITPMITFTMPSIDSIPRHGTIPSIVLSAVSPRWFSLCQARFAALICQGSIDPILFIAFVYLLCFSAIEEIKL